MRPQNEISSDELETTQKSKKNPHLTLPMGNVLTEEEYGFRPGRTLSMAFYFDETHYDRLNPEIKAAGLNSFLHFTKFGVHEGRCPNAWFDTKWYFNRYLSIENLSLEDINSFEHFCSIGNLLGFAPNKICENTYYGAARIWFDPIYYSRNNPDVITAGLDPWKHYCASGYTERRNPSRLFVASEYIDKIISPLASKVRFSNIKIINPLIHFCIVTMQNLPNRSDLKLNTTPPADDIQLLLSSPLFDQNHLKNEFNDIDTPYEIAKMYSAIPASENINPSWEFDTQFYADYYSRMPNTLSELALSLEQNALLHYLKVGKLAGLFRTRRCAAKAIEIVRNCGLFDAETYLDALNRPLMLPDPIADYIMYGHLEGIEPIRGISCKFVKQAYTPLFGAIVDCPVLFYLIHRKKSSWMFPTFEQLEKVAADVRLAPNFDEEYYREMAKISYDEDAARHFCIVGCLDRISPSDKFSVDYYLSSYSDIDQAPVNPLLHYTEHGMQEGRIPKREMEHETGNRGYNSNLPTIILVSHEASRTGAPIVALNICKMLANEFNVICWILKSEGILEDEFKSCCIELLHGGGGSSEAKQLLSEIVDNYNPIAAFVNSVVCHPIIPSIRLANIPIISLIHEFAIYVHPRGALTRMVFSSNITVFPAEVVKQSAIDEFEKLSVAINSSVTKIRPQGYNVSTSKNHVMKVDELKARIRLSPSSKTKILFGAGQVSYRKGLDWFFQTALILSNLSEFDWKFIWVGAGYDPERDLENSLYLNIQIENSGISEKCFIFAEQSNLEPFWKIADAFFLSSRLDPFPNVALDALMAELPVVCFNGVTGIADLGIKYPSVVSSVTIGDVLAAANAISASVREGAPRLDAQSRSRLIEDLSFESYYQDLKNITCECIKNAKERMNLYDLVAKSSETDIKDCFDKIDPVFKIGFPRDRHSMSVVLTDQISNGITSNIEVSEFGFVRCRFLGRNITNFYGKMDCASPPLDHLLHIHCEDPNQIAWLLNSGNWTARFLHNSNLIITVSDMKIYSELKSNFDVCSHLDDKIYENSICALSNVIDYALRSDTTANSENNISRRTVTTFRLNQDPGGDRWRPMSDVFDCIFSLITDAAFECLADNSDSTAVVPYPLRDCSTNRSRVILRQWGINIEKDRNLLPNGLIGTFCIKSLISFCEYFSSISDNKLGELTTEEFNSVVGAFFMEKFGYEKVLCPFPPGNWQ